MSSLLHDLDEGMLPISVFAPYLPIPAHKKRDRARAELAIIFSKIIRARRASGVKEQDVLQQFIDARCAVARSLQSGTLASWRVGNTLILSHGRCTSATIRQ